MNHEKVQRRRKRDGEITRVSVTVYRHIESRREAGRPHEESARPVGVIILSRPRCNAPWVINNGVAEVRWRERKRHRRTSLIASQRLARNRRTAQHRRERGGCLTSSLRVTIRGTRKKSHRS